MSGSKFWEQGASVWDPMHQVGLRAHYIASCALAPRAIEQQSRLVGTVRCLVVNISSWAGNSYTFNVAYGVGESTERGSTYRSIRFVSSREVR